MNSVKILSENDKKKKQREYYLNKSIRDQKALSMSLKLHIIESVVDWWLNSHILFQRSCV